MPNAMDAGKAAYQRILAAGRGGSGKSTQIWTLPGKKFAYFFDPSARAAVAGLNIDYEEFLPDAGDIDTALKGFNKGSKDDKAPGKAKEPRVYVEWTEDFNKRYTDGFFLNYDWLILDSFTTFQASMMDRIMWLNNRFGGIEDLADYRVAGSKMVDLARGIFSLPINIYATCHLNSFQDEKTKRVETQINLSGKGRTLVPLLCSNIWEFLPTDTKGGPGRSMRTRPEPFGFPDIRSSLRNLKPLEDVEIKNWNQPEAYGIGKLLRESGALILNTQKPQTPAATTTITTDTPAVESLPSVSEVAAKPAGLKLGQ